MFTYSAFADEISPNLEIQISELKKHDINYIEARGINGKNISDYTIDAAKIIKKQLDDNGFKLSALGSPIGKIQITDDFAPELEKFKKTLELSKIFDTKYIRIFSFFMDTTHASDYRDEVLKRLQKYIDVAKGCGVILLHENEKEIYGDEPIRCLDILETLNCDYFKATFDPANFVQCKIDTLYAFDMLEAYIEYMHIKDAYFENGKVVPAGMGDGNIKKILERLYNKNWDGFLSLEPHLGDFVGFSDLEKNKNITKEVTNPTKFNIAYKALNKILQEITL
ncbi:MAG: sugar phosphate isomerase/epimerase family protein [Oscillospiraceae bacterium]